MRERWRWGVSKKLLVGPWFIAMEGKAKFASLLSIAGIRKQHETQNVGLLVTNREDLFD